jgi:hypothetical protein
MTDDYAPSAGDHFTFGLWAVGNRLGEVGYGPERLDQLVTELLLGAR